MAADGPKILVVDDEPDLLDITASYLEMEGFTPLTALSGAAALEMMKVNPPDLIISDITMPGMSGFDLFEKVRADALLQNTPFVFLSGHTDLEHIMIGKELGSDDYLVKPYEPEMLISTIKGKLKRRRQIDNSVSQQIEALKSQLFRLVSHEMRTPLTSILGVTEILSQGAKSLAPDDFAEFLEMLKTGTSRLNRLVEDFLYVVRIDTGEIARETTAVSSDLAPLDVVERLCAAREEIKVKKGLTVELELLDEAPSASILPSHFENILSRFIDNAYTFTNAGGKIRVSSTKEGKRYLFSVADNGIGIPPEKQSGLFEKFHQVNREAQEQQGAGLGLYIARKLADLNKCEIAVESTEGRGSTFTLIVPKAGG
ncbi:MAG TPA: response regulator [Bacteroidota bacterium]|nr:response regulator [Bacteroidota bacterium]